jgi:hypothetical protein
MDHLYRLVHQRLARGQQVTQMQGVCRGAGAAAVLQDLQQGVLEKVDLLVVLLGLL